VRFIRSTCPLVHALPGRRLLAIDETGVGNFCQAVLNTVFAANAVKDMLECRGILLAIGELDAVASGFSNQWRNHWQLREDGVDAIGQHGDEIAQKLRRNPLAGRRLEQSPRGILPARSCNST